MPYNSKCFASNPCCRKNKTKQNKYFPLIIQEDEKICILNQPPFTIRFNEKEGVALGLFGVSVFKHERITVFLPLATPHPLPDGKKFPKVDRWQRELHSIDSGRWFEFLPD